MKNEFKYRLVAGGVLALVIAVGVRWVTSPVTSVSNGLPLEISAEGAKDAAPRDGSRNGSRNEPSNGVAVLKPVGMSGSPAPAVVQESLSEVRSGCFIAKFEHHRMRGHTTREECSRHQNEIVLSQESGAFRAFQEKTPVCVKLNGTPLEFEKKGNRIVFANVAGPDSIVTIQYCLGGTKGTDACAPKKDAFLSAVGADEDDASAGSGQWDAADRDDADLGTEFADLLEAEKRQPRGALASSSDWSADSVTSTR